MGAAKKKNNSNTNIEQIIKRAAKETVRELKRENMIMRNEQSYYQKTEKLLYSYPSLLEALKQKEKDIQFIKENGVQQTSKSVVIYSPSSGGTSTEEKYVEILDAYIASKERTERLITKIERALDGVKHDEYYEIIELKYLKKDEKVENDEDIAGKINVSDRTVRRHKKRLINEIQILLFGADAIDYL